MLIIAHDHHIVRKIPLFSQVIVVVELIGHIVVDGKHQSVGPAGNGQLSVKLHIAGARRGGDAFKIQVVAVIAVGLRIRHQPVDKALPVGCPGEIFSGAEIRKSSGLVEVIHHHPDLKPLFMGPLDIFFIYEVDVFALSIFDLYAGGADDVHDAFGVFAHAVQGIQGRGSAKDRMPSQNHLFLQLLMLEYRRFKGRFRRFLRRLSQGPVLDISDDAASGNHPGPAVHFLQKLQGLALLHVCQDRRLYAASGTNLGIPLRVGQLIGRPVVVNEYPLGAFLFSGKLVAADVRILADHLKADAHLPVFKDLVNRVAIGIPGIRRIPHHLIRQGIDQLPVLRLPVKPLVQICLDPGHRKVNGSPLCSSADLPVQGVVQVDPYLRSGGLKPFVQILSFRRGGIALCDHASQKPSCQYHDQQHGDEWDQCPSLFLPPAGVDAFQILLGHLRDPVFSVPRGSSAFPAAGSSFCHLFCSFIPI